MNQSSVVSAPSVRERIVSAARERFRRDGIAATSMDEIAAMVGLARPNLYRYVGSRQELLCAVLVAEIRDINAARWTRVKLAGPVRSVILDSLLAGHDIANDYIARVALVGEARSITAEVLSQEPGIVAAEYEFWGPVLEYGRARGEIAPHLPNEHIVRWFQTSQVLVSEHPELIPDGDLAAWFGNFVVPPVLRIAS
jgi:AcrR family transcriptional regulator